MRLLMALLSVLLIAACDSTATGENLNPNRPWGPDEVISGVGKRDCGRIQPPADHPMRSKWDRTCLKNDN